MEKIAVLGAGSWGTALATIFAKNNHAVRLWGRDEVQVREMQVSRHNSRYLKDVKFPDQITCVSDLSEAVRDCRAVILAVSSQANREIMERIKPFVSNETIIVNVSKGLEKETNLRASELCKEILPQNPFVVLSGPSHAEEVAQEMPTTLVAASENVNAMRYVQAAASNEYIRVYTNSDVIGVELGGALKNIIALGAGVLAGLEYGDNTLAALMTRGMTEMVRLGIALGAEEATFFGLSGIGDLIVTCTSNHSRNRRAGILIGQGKTLAETTQAIQMVVEGITSTQIAHELSQRIGIEMPIVNQLYEVLYHGQTPREAVKALMIRDKKNEIEDLLDLHRK